MIPLFQFRDFYVPSTASAAAPVDHGRHVTADTDMFSLFVRFKFGSGAASAPNAARGDGAGSGTRFQGATAFAGDPSGDGGARRFLRVMQHKAVELGDVLDVLCYLEAAERSYGEGWCCRCCSGWA